MISNNTPTEQQLDLDAIEQRANAATKGPWHLTDSDAIVAPLTGVKIADVWEPTAASRNGEFIEAASPETVKALVAEVRRLRDDSRIEELTATLREVLGTFSPMHDTYGGPVAYYDGSADIDPTRFARWQAVLEVNTPPPTSVCGVCKGVVGWIDCPTGGWWSHEVHPDDGHDAAPRAARHDEPTVSDTLPAWLYQRFMPGGAGWDALDDADRAYWEHQARAVRRAVARGGFKTSRPAAAVVVPAVAETSETNA